MQFGRSDLADLFYFLEIARQRNFRRAGAALGVSASALSHAMRGLEARLGVRLLNRTSRSVTLTAAGEALRDSIQSPFEDIGRGVEVLNRFRDAPMGRVRLSVPSAAAQFLIGPVMPIFLDRYPDVEVEVSVTNRMIDVVGGGFDAGVRFGGTVPEDMIAQQVAPDFRWIVVGAPAYFERHRRPAHPDDLRDHRCVRVRTGDDRIYRWEFERQGQTLAVDAPGGLTVDDGAAAMAALMQGQVLMYLPDFVAAEGLAADALTSVLDDWAATGPGFHVYYSSRRQLPGALRLLIDLLKELRPLG